MFSPSPDILYITVPPILEKTFNIPNLFESLLIFFQDLAYRDLKCVPSFCICLWILKIWIIKSYHSNTCLNNCSTLHQRCILLFFLFQFVLTLDVDSPVYRWNETHHKWMSKHIIFEQSYICFNTYVDPILSGLHIHIVTISITIHYINLFRVLASQLMFRRFILKFW